jgi:hypothetical protein
MRRGGTNYGRLFELAAVVAERNSSWEVRLSLAAVLMVRVHSSVRGAGGIPPDALQPTEAYCANTAFWFPVYLQRRSTSNDVRDRWRALVSTVKTFGFRKNEGNFLTGCEDWLASQEGLCSMK